MSCYLSPNQFIHSSSRIVYSSIFLFPNFPQTSIQLPFFKLSKFHFSNNFDDRILEIHRRSTHLGSFFNWAKKKEEPLTQETLYSFPDSSSIDMWPDITIDSFSGGSSEAKTHWDPENQTLVFSGTLRSGNTQTNSKRSGFCAIHSKKFSEKLNFDSAGLNCIELFLRSNSSCYFKLFLNRSGVLFPNQHIIPVPKNVWTKAKLFFKNFTSIDDSEVNGENICKFGISIQIPDTLTLNEEFKSLPENCFQSNFNHVSWRVLFNQNWKRLAWITPPNPSDFLSTSSSPQNQMTKENPFKLEIRSIKAVSANPLLPCVILYDSIDQWIQEEKEGGDFLSKFPYDGEYDTGFWNDPRIGRILGSQDQLQKEGKLFVNEDGSISLPSLTDKEFENDEEVMEFLTKNSKDGAYHYFLELNSNQNQNETNNDPKKE